MITQKNGRLSVRPPTASNVVYDEASRQGNGSVSEPTTGTVSADSAIPWLKSDATTRTAEIRKAATRGYADFRRTCDDLAEAALHADDYLLNGEVSDEGLEVIVQVDELLERLYQCDWGEGESVKRVVVAIKSQLNNVRWTERHVGFLKDAAFKIRNRYLINDQFVEECLDLIEAHNLDLFRGVLSSEGIRRYRLEEIHEDEP